MAYTKTLAHAPETATYWAGQSVDSGALIVEQPDATLGCNLLQVAWSRGTPAGTREDLATINFHIAKVVGGGLFSALIAAELAPIETIMDTWFTALNAQISNDYTLVGYTWWENRASHAAYPDGSEVIGPPIRVTSRSVVGGSTGRSLPYQDAATTTWRTCSRKHWGRVYVPGYTANALSSAQGRIDNPRVDELAAAWHTAIASLTTASQTIGVWTYRFKAFIDMSQLEVDNVWDIQRRRRAKQASYRKIYTS